MFAHMEKRKMKAILDSIEAKFLKKALGTITAKTEMGELPTTAGKHLVRVPVSLRNADGIEVATVVATWSILIEEKKA